MANIHLNAEAAPTAPTELIDLADPSIELARSWANSAPAVSTGSAALLAKVLQDPNGLAFTIGFVDRVVRPEDLRVAAHSLAEIAGGVPAFLPWYMRAAVRVGGALAPALPGVVVPIARAVLRRMVGHLIVDARPSKLGKAVAALRRSGARLNLNLLGEAVMGEEEAGRRIAGTQQLLARPDVDYVSIKVSSVVSQLTMWAFDETVARVVERLTPLYEFAAASSTAKFINLDMEEYRDLDLTLAVFTRILDQPQLDGLEAGIVLQAYLPDALRALQDLTAWAQARVARGGAPIKVRLVKGANLAMETVDAIEHGWPQATYPSKQDTDTNYKRVLDWALTPEHTTAVKLGVAGHNLFDVAFAHLLSTRRGVADRVEFEMLLGMAQGQAAQVRKAVGGLLLYTPVVQPKEFDVAISYLVRRLEENASPTNFMSAVFQLAENAELFARERDRFLASLAAVRRDVPTPNRIQSRLTEEPQPLPSGFQNTEDTDPSLSANRSWGRNIIAASRESALGVAQIAAAAVTTHDQLDGIIAAAGPAGRSWASLGGHGRATILRAAAGALEQRRGQLLEVMANETGKTIAEGDPEVSEAIDFANYYAAQAERLDETDGATFIPSTLTVVTPPWNFPLAIPAGSTLSALAAGSSVIVKPARQSQRTGALMVEALWAGGVPRDVLQLVSLADRDLGRHLVAHRAVDRVILTGAYETAQLFRSWRPDLPLLAETSGKNSIIVTPSADLDLAVADIVKSAFGHAGQKCSAASVAILVGSVARSERFRRQLLDAASTLTVGYPSDPTTQMGPIIEPASGKLLRGLTTLGPGESWLLQPRKLDDSGRLWSPGIRVGVAAGSDFHRTEFFGPVLGIMAATTLHEAIELQNGTDYGLTAGLHTLDSNELTVWLDGVEAGNLYVNRGITGAIVQRQPFGGWKRSSVGAGTKAGGPNYLAGLGSWRSRPSTAAATRLLPAVDSLLRDTATALAADHGAAIRAASSDQAAWDAEFGAARDVSGLGLERNVFRYRPAEVAVRVAEGSSIFEVVRVTAAGLRSGARFTLSTGSIPETVRSALGRTGIPVTVESDQTWLDRLRQEGSPAARIRAVGARAVGARAEATDGATGTAVCEALRGNPAVAVYSGAVTESGRVELLPFLREQAVAITAHRFGNPDPWSDGII